MKGIKTHLLNGVTCSVINVLFVLLQLEQTSKSIDSSAHMITTARVPADKPVRIAFSLSDSPGTV